MPEKTAAEEIDYIVSLHKDWQGELITRLRKIILAADDSVFEEVKWKMPSRPEGLPVWSSNGIICILETFKNDSKLVFFKGAFLDDPKNLFNARLKSATDRAIEFHEGYSIDEPGLNNLLIQAVDYNAKSKN